MADYRGFIPKLLIHEGGFTVDHAGPTNMGITLTNWRTFGYDKTGDGRITVEDLKRINKSDAALVYKKQYWDYFLADQILDQSVAEIIVDWGVNSGQQRIAILLNRLLGIADKLTTINSLTISRINSVSGGYLFNRLWNLRDKYYRYLAESPTYYDPLFVNLGLAHSRVKYGKFLTGWLDRLSKIQYSGATYYQPQFIQKVVAPAIKVSAPTARIASYTPKAIQTRKPITLKTAFAA